MYIKKKEYFFLIYLTKTVVRHILTLIALADGGTVCTPRVCVWGGTRVVCTPALRYTLIHIPLLDFYPFLKICRNEGVLYKDRGGDNIYYNLLEPQGLTTSYFILMYLRSQPHIFFPVSP